MTYIAAPLKNEDIPETVFAAQRLRRKLCPAYLAGDVAHVAGAIVELFPGSLLAFGEEVSALAALIRSIPGWKSLGIAPRHAEELRTLIERESGATLRAEEAIFFTLPTPAVPYSHPTVRLLQPHEVELALTGPGGGIGAAYGSPQMLLAEGFVAGAVVDGRLVARAHTSCQSARYADIAVATDEQWRGQGLATAAASLVCQQVQQQRRTPIWSTSVDNWASRKIAEKLGFVEWSHLVYLTPETHV
jgi:GNAT superfamily N-acetyltransferase